MGKIFDFTEYQGKRVKVVSSNKKRYQNEGIIGLLGE